jgi:hypothetical protein
VQESHVHMMDREVYWKYVHWFVRSFLFVLYIIRTEGGEVEEHTSHEFYEGQRSSSRFIQIHLPHNDEL